MNIRTLHDNFGPAAVLSLSRYPAVSSDSLLTILCHFPWKQFLRIILLTLFIAFFSTVSTLAQERDTVQVRPPAPPPEDSLIQTTPDSLRLPSPDSTTAQLQSNSPSASSQSTASSGNLDNPVLFTARDSLIIDLGSSEGDTGSLYGDVQITYGETKMQAHEVEILFESDEIHAKGLPVDTGMVGRPRFNQGSEEFIGDQMAFNLRTERGRVTVAETQYDDGQIRGGIVKVTEDSTLYIKDGVYTTCDCIDDPSYSLRSNKMKVVDQEKIFTGPIQLFLFNIPTPLWLPFGFLPAQNTRRSGLLAPTYGEDESGFYLRDLGWYFAISDYHDLQLRGGIWTSGSWKASSLWRYNKRYGYSGQVYLDYSRLRSGEPGDLNFDIRRISSLRWQHNHTLNPSTSLTSNVNLSTQRFLRDVSERYNDRVSQSISSSISFRKRWANTGRSLSLNINQNQVLSTNTTSMTLPNLTFSQNSRKPFARETRPPGSKEQWYERITYNYNFTLNNRYNFSPIQDDSLLAANGGDGITWFDALLSRDNFDRATGGDDEPFDFRASHRIPINASFSARKISLNVTPSINYTENWYIQTNRQFLSIDPEDSTTSVVTEPQPGFFALRQFSSSLSANTTIYGIFPLKVGTIDGFRHTLRPTLSFTYRPDFEGSFWGYTRSYTDDVGEEVDYRIVNEVQRGLQQALSLSLNNIFEAKRVEVDSTGAEQSTTLKLLNLDGSTSYNFAADSLNLSNINLTARTNLFKNKMNINLRSTFSPYELNRETNRVIDEYIFDLSKFRFARLTQMSVSASTSFRSNSGSSGRPLETSRAAQPGFSDFGSPGFNPDAAIAGSLVNPTGDPVDFNIPWSLSLDFTYSLQKSTGTANRTTTLNGRFDFSLTPNWKVQGRTGYDFQRKEVVTTNLSFFRDFECWQMSLNWVPFGRFQSFGFNLQVKSGQLKDLLRIQQPKSDVRGRFGSAF